MDLTNLAGQLAKIGAPILGGALGGPVGAALASSIIGALSDAFGVPATPEAVGKAIQTNPQAAEIVKQVEAAQGQAVLDELNARLADVQNARAMQIAAVQSASWTAYTPHVLAYLLALSFILTIAALFFKALPESNIVMVLIGALVSEFRGSLAFFFGSSSNSKTKDETISAMAGKPRK